MRMNKIAALILFSIGTVLATAQSGEYFPLSWNEYLQRVTENNLELIAERYNIPISEAEIAMQKLFVDPELTFEAGEDYYLLELGFTFELGKRRARADVARSETEMAKLALEWFFQELRAEAADAYLEALLQRDLLKLKQDNYEYMAQLALFDSIRYRAGEIPETDARQSALEAATLLNELYEQHGEFRSALSALNLFMGDLSGTLYDPAGKMVNHDTAYDLDYLLELGVGNRVDLAAAYVDMETSLRGLKLVRAERRPDIQVMVGFERDWHGFWPKRDMLKAGVTIPLQFSNVNRSALRQAEYQTEQTRTMTMSAELEIKTEIMQAFFAYEALGKQVEQFRGGMLENAQKILDGIVFRYKRGESDIIEVLVAQRTFNEVSEEYLQKVKEYASALVELQRCCGVWNVQF